MADLNVKINNLNFKNPVMTASGPLGTVLSLQILYHLMNLEASS